jgi:hypothetical protein
LLPVIHSQCRWKNRYQHLHRLNPGAFILINQYHYNAGDSFTDKVSGKETVKDVEVRNHKEVWITERRMASPIADQPNANRLHASHWLRWEENGIVYSILGDSLIFEDMLQLAQNLK